LSQVKRELKDVRATQASNQLSELLEESKMPKKVLRAQTVELPDFMSNQF
jgi:hypothetical protein